MRNPAAPLPPDLPLSAEAAGEFHAKLLAWYRSAARDYPWRQTTDPYAILVSEMMLQQTQIATVLGRGYYTRWMERFPDAATLAAAGESDILQAWEGLGYYSRARHLQRAAAAVMKHHAGQFPRSLDGILALPGVGRYTAGAVYSFAFNLPAPIVDGNIARIFARLFRMEEAINSPAGQKTLWAWAAALTHQTAPREANSAIMELGQRLCTPRRPACADCPVQAFCQTAGPAAADYPKKIPARKTVTVSEHVLWTLRGGRLLLHRETGRRRQGLWRLPERSAEEVPDLPCVLQFPYAITHHRVTLSVYEAPGAAARPGETWHALDQLAQLPMPGPFRRAVDALLHRD